MQHAQDENAGVGEPVIDGMAGMFVAAQAGAKEPIIPAQKGLSTREAKQFRRPRLYTSACVGPKVSNV